MKSKCLFTLGLLLALAGVMFPGLAEAYTISISREDIQAQVARNFPVKEENMFSSLILQNPRVDLKEGSERVGLTVDAVVTALGGMETRGVVHLDGSLKYVREKGEFILADPVARSMEIDGVGDSIRRKMEEIVTAALQDKFNDDPIYKFDPKDMTQAMIMSALKSVKVTGGKLVIEFSMP